MKLNLNLKLMLVIGIITGLFVSSCKKDTFTEQDAYNAQTNLLLLRDSLLRDSMLAVGGVVSYSVNVIDASSAGYGTKSVNSEMGMPGAVVWISQYGKIEKDTTDVSGMVVFDDFRIGTINVSISLNGFTKVDYVVEIKQVSGSMARHVSNMIPIFSTTSNLSTIQGIATIETDLTNTGRENAAGVTVKGIIDVSDPSFTHYLTQTVSNPDLEGKIVHIAYQSVVSEAVSDNQGAYSLLVPSTPDGLPIKVIMSEFAVNQTLLLNTLDLEPVFGVQTVRTIFSSDIDGDISSPSSIPDVPGAYVVIGAPTGQGNPQPTVAATAVAEISESGIASISINNPGEGYTQAPVVIISKGTGYNSIAATATASITNGKITNVAINQAGQGYKPTDVPSISVLDGIDVIATAEAKMTYSIKDINVNNAGDGYLTVPAITIQAPTGTGAAAQAVLSGYVQKIDIVTPGSGYTQAPNVILTSTSGTGATAIASMSLFNPINSIQLINFNTLYLTTPDVVITPSGTGSGATANATLSNAGSVVNINVTTAGAGYIEAPMVTISGGGGHGATAYATLTAGSVNVFLIDGGEGYTGNPTVNITQAPAGGVNAIASAQRGFKVQSLQITSPGSGYDTKPFMSIGGVGVANNEYEVLFSQSVVSIFVTDAGSNYATAPAVVFSPVDGNGAGATATSTIRSFVKDIVVTNQGSGYSGDIVVTIAPPTEGIQATASAVKGNGVLASAILINGGQGYVAAPLVRLVQNGGLIPEVNAQITATVSNGRVSALQITNPGAGYDPSATYSIDISTKTLAASLSASVNPNSGQISFVRITNPGAGYEVIPTVEFEVPNASGYGTGATATAVLTDGRVSSITITNAGQGYYMAPAVKIVVNSHNLTAIGRCDVSTDGYIDGVYFDEDGLTYGQGYVAVPSVTFFPSVPGMGTGATGVAIIENGRIKEINMTNKGQGYFGKNRPTVAKPFIVIPYGMTESIIMATAGKTYVRDVYIGTGKRTIEE